MKSIIELEMKNTRFQNERLISIDCFRGMIIIAMVIVNFFKGLSWFPSFLRHASPGGVTFVDIIAPAFIFVIALTYPLSYNKRIEKDGKKAAAGHAVRRSLSLIGIEVLFYLYVQLFYKYKEQVVWNTLSIIGFTTLVSLPFLNRKSFIKLIIGCALIVFHQLVPLAKFGYSIYRAGGGAYSLAGWSSVIFISLFMSDLLLDRRDKPKRLLFVMMGFVFLLTGIVSGFWLPYLRDGISLSLCFLSIGITSLVFYLFYHFNDRIGTGLSILAAWGRNPLLIFLVSLLFIPFNLSNRGNYIFSGPNWYLAVYFTGYMAFLQVIVSQLNKRDIIIKL